MNETETIIKIDHVKKQYRLGLIGGGSLQADLQSWWAKKRGKEDPNLKIGAKAQVRGQKFLALDDVTFDVKRGERIGIIGHNGAGKSTLLKLLSRVTAPTEGNIYLNGRVSSMLEVGTGFHAELTGRQNIYMNGAILGMSKAEIDSKIEQIIEFSECRQFIDTPVKRYSSGMYVKLAFSVAAHLDSEILIMDEVLAVGDMKFQQKCIEKMKDVAYEEGRTILYVSHNMSTIRQLCNRCIVLDHGKVIYNGDVETAIDLYLDVGDFDKIVDFDLRESRMPHLSKKICGKIERVVLKDKSSPVYEMNESIPFSVWVHANEKLDDVCMRLEIYTIGETPVGTSYYQKITSMEAGEDKRFEFCLRTPHIVPGKYKALLCFYQVNKAGTYYDLDAVFPSFAFEVVDTKDQLQIEWLYKTWGHINFDSIATDQ